MSNTQAWAGRPHDGITKTILHQEKLIEQSDRPVNNRKHEQK
jgi:hypothetical protein